MGVDGARARAPRHFRAALFVVRCSLRAAPCRSPVGGGGVGHGRAVPNPRGRVGKLGNTMITFTTGDLLESHAEALVNAVNTVGVMGKGIALTFKQTFPENYRLYAAACKRGDVRTGTMFVTRRDPEHFRDPSRLDWIRTGLADLARVIQENHIRSIALPALGCGLGGLDWRDVRPLIEQALGSLQAVEVLVYEPNA